MSKRKNISSHLDKSVIQMFIVVFLIANVTLAFKYINDTPCDEVLFRHSANAYRVGEMIKFNDVSYGAESWNWNFGDGSEMSSQKNPLYIYSEPGDYEIRLMVNGKCEKTETISIAEKLVLLDTTKLPKFELPKSITYGEVLEVEDQTANATSWEWRFGETAGANATTKKASYLYETPGLKTVSLIVNNDLNHIRKKKINVIPTPESKEKVAKMKRQRRDKRLDLNEAPKGSEVLAEKPSGKPSAMPFITTGNFENKIKMVAEGKLNPQVFSEFFCDDKNPLIVVNGRNSTFNSFCESISEQKIKIKSLKLIRKSGSNCITSFAVEYKKSKLF